MVRGDQDLKTEKLQKTRSPIRVFAMARLRLGSWSSIVAIMRPYYDFKVAEFNLSSFLFLLLGDILVSTLSALIHVG